MRNDAFSADEGFFFVLSLIFAIAGAGLWYARLIRIVSLGRSHGRVLLAITPLLAIAPLAPVLFLWADPVYVVGHPAYQALFGLGGLAWIWISALLLPLLGLSVRDDALERRNRAAAIACGGMICGATVIYACSNIGGGPTIWTTLVPALAATLCWLFLHLLLELAARPSEAIAIDRDPATAVRHAAFSIAAGMILGRAVAGDWRNWDMTWRELFGQAWPACFLALIAAIIHRIFRPTPRIALPCILRTAVLPAAVFLLAAVIDWLWLGAPEIGKYFVSYEQYMGGK